MTHSNGRPIHETATTGRANTIDPANRTAVTLAATSAITITTTDPHDRVTTASARRQRVAAVLRQRRIAAALDDLLGVDRWTPVDEHGDYWSDAQMDLGVRERELAGMVAAK